MEKISKFVLLLWPLKMFADFFSPKDFLDGPDCFFFPQTEMVIHVLVIKTPLYMLESINLRKEVFFLHPTSYNQSLPFVLLSIIHHVLTHSVSSRSLPLGLTRTSPSPSRLGAHPSILFLPLSSFIHLSIFLLLHSEKSPLFLLWVPL